MVWKLSGAILCQCLIRRIRHEFVKKRQIEERLQAEIESVKSQRNGLLARSDWTQISDVPKSIKDKYKTYRKRLRDIPLQAGFPFTIEWPEIEE